MKTDILIRQIMEIKELLEQYATTEAIPEIEKDILLNKLQEIYRSIKFSGVMVGAEPQASIQPEKVEEKVQEVLLEIETAEPEQVKSVEKPVDTEQKIAEKEASTRQATGKTLADLYSTKSPLINEVLAEKMRKKDLSTVLQSKPIQSLEEAIDINAKFLFVRELFFNNLQLFEKTVRAIDAAPTFNDAFNYLQQQFMWNYDSETVQKFLELVRRRFIKDEP